MALFDLLMITQLYHRQTPWTPLVNLQFMNLKQIRQLCRTLQSDLGFGFLLTIKFSERAFEMFFLPVKRKEKLKLVKGFDKVEVYKKKYNIT